MPLLQYFSYFCAICIIFAPSYTMQITCICVKSYMLKENVVISVKSAELIQIFVIVIPEFIAIFRLRLNVWKIKANQVLCVCFIHLSESLSQVNRCSSGTMNIDTSPALLGRYRIQSVSPQDSTSGQSSHVDLPNSQSGNILPQLC